MNIRRIRPSAVALAIPYVVFAMLGLLHVAGLVAPPGLDPVSGHPTVPLASGWGLLALLLLIIAGGFYMARRTPSG